MTPHVLAQTLRALDVRLEARGDRLHVEAPRGALTLELRAALVTHKAALLALLRDDPGPPPWVAEFPVALDDWPDFCDRWNVRLARVVWAKDGPIAIVEPRPAVPIQEMHP